MSEFRIVPLKRASEASPDGVGPKAMSLIQLGRIHLPVPPAFCITARAYADHLLENHLLPQLEQDVGALEYQSGSDLENHLARIRKSIAEAPLSDELSRDIEHHLATLPPGRYAVRSSATLEDLPGHSFAGLHDTILGVSDLPSCLDAVKKCWASLWAHRAYHYRRNKGFGHLNAKMAVIVQTLIPADSSGVIFTANPLTGRPGNITIEACFGLGEALVSGRITPDRFTFQKRNLRLTYSLIAEKAMACQLDDTGRVSEIPLESTRSKAASLDKRTGKKLARLAIRAEKALGCPQDLEWACHKKHLYFLQSRPITAKPKPLTWEDRQVWTNLNLGEVAPDVVTPITHTFLRPKLYRLFGTIFKILCVDLDDHPIADVVAGRLYFNVNTGFGLFGHLPLMKQEDFDSILGGAHSELYRAGFLDLAEEDIPQLGGSFTKMILRLPLTIYDLYTHRPARAQRGLETLMARNRYFAALDLSSLTTPELVDSLKTVFEIAFVDIDLMHVMTSLYALPFLYQLSSAWLDDGNGTLTSRLFMGLGNMAHAEAGLAIWRLAHRAHRNPAIEKIILARKPWPQTRKELETLPEGVPFLKAWDAFLQEHGHHCRGELEFYNPRWAETPDYCLDMVRSHISSIGFKDPRQHEEERARERRQAVEVCRRRLKNPIKRWLFGYFLRQAQHGCVLRENFKNEAVRLFANGRRILCELGRRLQEKGSLEQPDDIFFLECDEIEPLIPGNVPPNLRATIRSRRREYEKFCSLSPPKVIIGKFDPDNFAADPVDTSLTIFKGISASPGVVTGKARVILKADMEQHLQPGEILVAPFTDPGWTPYFLTAAAIVMDQGGILSHGSIIAREYGIPAVINVGPATRIIRTGQTITVDADRGIVKILN